MSEISKTEMAINEIDSEINRLRSRLEKLEVSKQKLVESKSAQSITEPKASIKKVAVIGGGGQLGKRFVTLFEKANHQVSVIEKDDWEKAQAVFKEVDLILIAVPIHFTEQVIRKLTEFSKSTFKEDCILADITSIKSKPLECMLSSFNGPVVGLHPMFGPDVEDFNDQTIVVCPGRELEKCNWLLEFLRELGAQLHQVSAQEHDETMAIVQVLRHFSTVVYGAHLAQEDSRLSDILAMSSPIYRLELAMVGRLFAQSPDLYTEIIFSNPSNINMMKRFITRFENLLEFIKTDNKAAFRQSFEQTKNWFGDYADKFLHESSDLLAAAHSVKSKTQ